MRDFDIKSSHLTRKSKVGHIVICYSKAFMLLSGFERGLLGVKESWFE